MQLWPSLLALFLVLCLPFSSAAGSRNTEPEILTAKKNFMIVGYISGRRKDTKATIDAQINKVTHVNYAFVNPTDDATGAIKPINNLANFEYVVTTTKAAGKKVFLSFGGWRGDDSGYDLVYEEIAANPKARDFFINNILDLVKAYNLDGIDMDWEYPRLETADIYADFIELLAARLHKEGKQLTAAVIGTKTKVTDDGDGAAYLDRALAAFDWINLMAYDDTPTNHSPYNLVERSVQYWLTERGVPAKKLVLGLPIYARPSWRSYSEVVSVDRYFACQDQVIFEDKLDYFNGTQTIKRKTQFAIKQQLAGVMVWELPLDSFDPELSIMQAINDSVAGHSGSDFCQKMPKVND